MRADKAAAVNKKALDATWGLAEWIAEKLQYHSRVDHQFEMPDDMAWNLASNIAQGQVEMAKACFERAKESN